MFSVPDATNLSKRSYKPPLFSSAGCRTAKTDFNVSMIDGSSGTLEYRRNPELVTEASGIKPVQSQSGLRKSSTPEGRLADIRRSSHAWALVRDTASVHRKSEASHVEVEAGSRSP